MTLLSSGRRLLVAGVLALAVGLAAGCGGSSSDGSSTTAKSVAANAPVKGTLTFWSSLTATSEKAWWEKLIKRFEQQHPGAKVEFTTYSTEEYFTKLLASFSSGDQPDVFVADAGEELNKFVRTGKVATLNKIADLSPFKPAAVKPLTGANGDVHGIPLAWYILLLWQNKSLLAKHGLEAPKTWDQLLSTCDKLNADGIAPIALGDGGQDQWTAAQWLGTLLYQYGGPTAAIDATYGTGGASWTDRAFVQAATRLKQLIDAKCFPNGFNGLNYSQMSTLFLQQKAALDFTGAWLTSEYQSGGAKFDIEPLPLPDGPGAVNSTGTLHGIVGGVFGLAATTKGVDGNPALVKAFLGAAAASVDDFANANARLSVAVKPDPQGGALQAKLTQMLASVDELAPITDVMLPAALLADYYQNIGALTAGDLSPQAFAKAMAAATDKERPNLPKLAG
ncbi:MAG TPA: extracellular solute-binding protein [Conexibacter sp.]|jgi:raffinose/stachyose/melibiose transport system substrate-binding protein|nr:extracellular solute-binding protein [Conexibacter sp.]